jgi:hypothetical protein
VSQQGKPSRTPSPDADLTRAFGVGCLVLFVAFLLLWAMVWFFYMRV